MTAMSNNLLSICHIIVEKLYCEDIYILQFGTILYQCVTDKSSHTPSKTHQSFIVNKSGVG